MTFMQRSFPTLRKWLVATFPRKMGPIALLALVLLGSSACGPPDPLGGGGPFAGVWNATYTDPTFGRVASQLILQRAGSFQKQDAGLDTGTLVTIYGTFRVFSDQSLLRLDITRGEPTQTCGPLGCNPIRYPAGESYTYRFVDANTLLLHFAYCAPDQCNYTYRRGV